MVLGRVDDVPHAGVLGRLGPDGRVELDRVERLGQLLVAALVFDVIGKAAAAPGFVFGADAPGFDDTPLAVGAPVHHQAELDVLEPLQLLQDEGVGFFIIRGRLGGGAGQGGSPEDRDEEKDDQDFAFHGLSFPIRMPPILPRGEAGSKLQV